MPQVARARLMLLLAALLWSSGGLLIKTVQWNPMAIAGTRSLIGAVVIGLALWPRMRFTGSFAQVGGAVVYAATVTTFVAATKLTTAANAILLQYTAPVYVAIFGAWFLGEEADRRDWITVVAVLGGMVLFFLDDLSFRGLAGNAVAAFSGMCFAWTTLFLRKQNLARTFHTSSTAGAQSRLSADFSSVGLLDVGLTTPAQPSVGKVAIQAPLSALATNKCEKSGLGSAVETIFLGNVMAAIIGLPFMLRDVPHDRRSWIALVLLGVFQLGLPYTLFALAMRHVRALEAVLIPMIEPLLNPIWVLIAVGERPGRWSLAGGAIVIGVILARTLTFRPAAPPFPRS